jgi:IS6 family transposase
MQTPRVINVDKNAAYPIAMATLKGDETLAETTELRQVKYLNNVVEQDHRNIKRITKPMRQVNGIERGDSVSQVRFVESIFGIAA